ncbi:MAG: 50S ribosomal protein L6 [Candidatus Hodarchaeota archaeon]
MPKKQLITEKLISIPENVTVDIREGQVQVKGPKGTLSRDFTRLPVMIEKTSTNSLRFSTSFPRTREHAAVGTAAGHVKNMFKGVTEGFMRKMVVLSSHFPMTVKVQGNNLVIEKLYGQKENILVPFPKDVKIETKNEEITITGIDVEKVGQIAANIHRACLWRGKRAKDPTVFMDGIYITEKS